MLPPVSVPTMMLLLLLSVLYFLHHLPCVALASLELAAILPPSLWWEPYYRENHDVCLFVTAYFS